MPGAASAGPTLGHARRGQTDLGLAGLCKQTEEKDKRAQQQELDVYTHTQHKCHSTALFQAGIVDIPMQQAQHQQKKTCSTKNDAL